MIRQKLRDLDLKITELADYMQVSRPTMYKFIEYYDTAEFSLISPKVLKLFNYINEHELIGRKNVISFILSNLTDATAVDTDSEMEVIKIIRNHIVTNPESKKSQFITVCATQDSFNDLFGYLVRIQPLLQKKRLTAEEKALLQPYIQFKEEIKKTEE